MAARPITNRLPVFQLELLVAHTLTSHGLPSAAYQGLETFCMQVSLYNVSSRHVHYQSASSHHQLKFVRCPQQVPQVAVLTPYRVATPVAAIGQPVCLQVQAWFT